MPTQQFEIIEFETESGDKINVEVIVEHTEGYIPAGGEFQEHKTAKVTFEKAISLIAPIANGVIKAIDNMSQIPDEFEVAFHIALSGELNLKLVTLGSDANMEVKLTWKGKTVC